MPDPDEKFFDMIPRRIHAHFNLSGFKKTNIGAPPKVPFMGTDAKGNKLRLDAFNENSFGFMRVSVSAGAVKGEFLAVDVNTKAVTLTDHFTLDLNRHTVN